MKRNVGLVLARMLGWQRIFFLDDDIRDIAYPDLQRTVDMLGSFSAAGMWVTDFPDNSIVCHANRDDRRIPGCLRERRRPGRGLRADIGFFPDIYNEDWLFFFDDASKGRLGNSCLKATQLVLLPVRQREASGLAGIRRRPRGRALRATAPWPGRRSRRRANTGLFSSKHGEISSRPRSPALSEAPPDMRDEMIASLQSALKCLSGINPDLCARYVEAWRQDLRDWKRQWAEIPVMPSVGCGAGGAGTVPTPANSRSGSCIPRTEPHDRCARASHHPSVRHSEGDGGTLQRAAPRFARP